jgi:hypothetical protein
MPPTVIRSLEVIKKPRVGPIPDRPINFKPFYNLHLEMIEIKEKLKKGLAPIKYVPKPRKESIEPESVKENFSQQDMLEIETSSVHTAPRQPGARRIPKPILKQPRDDDELFAELGVDNGSVGKQSVTIEGSEAGMSEIEPTEGEMTEGEMTEEGEYEEDEEEDDDDPYAGLSPEEREKMEREEYLWRFRILKKQYKTSTVPISEYNEHSDVEMMKRDYDRTVKELTLDGNVESYRTYLVYSWIAIEFASTQYIGIDMGGFARSQIAVMNQYERLLVELGEKRRDTWASNLPVELRLAGLVLFQAAAFYIGKIITSKFGGSVAELFKGMTGQPAEEKPHDNSGETPTPKPKKRMRGPSADLKAHMEEHDHDD